MNKDNKLDKSKLTKASLPKLTRKQQAFVNELINNPKQSATQAVLKTYNASNRHTAEVIASENLSKPVILQHLTENSIRAERVIVSLLDGAKKEETKLAAAKDILDRVHGKATQRTEVVSTGITLNIDLTQSLE